MNREIAIGHWNEWTGAMRERWGRLTDDEWQQIEGNREQLVGALQRHYGYTREQADLDIDEFVARRTAVPEPSSSQAAPLPEFGPEDAAIDNGVRAQPGDVLGLDTDGETTALGETDEDEDRRRVDALRDAPPAKPNVRNARR